MKLSFTRIIQVSLALILNWLSLPVQAEVFRSSTNLATAGSGRAAVVPADVNYLNPAALRHTRGAHFFASTGKDYYLVGLSDASKDVILPASFGYAQKERWMKKTDSGEFSLLTDEELALTEKANQTRVLVKDISLAVADYLWAGASVGLTFHQQSVYFEGDRDYGVASVDAGVLYPVNASFGLGFTLTNLGGSSGAVPIALKPATKFGIAMHYIFKEFFRVRLDLESNENNSLPKSAAMLGIEDYLSRFLVLRMGIRNEPAQEKQFAAAGLGFESPRFGVNYGYQKEIQGGDNSKHSIDLHVPF